MANPNQAGSQQGEPKQAKAKAAAPKPADTQVASAEPAEPRRTGPKPTPKLLERYRNEVLPAMLKEFGYTNVMSVPRIVKVTLNIGMGEALQNAKSLDAATGDMTIIAGQKPVITKATKSIANFKLRTGNAIGVMVTLRGERMWSFLDRLMNVALPRQRDFRGISPDSFDGRGNYSLGLREQLVWPEIQYDKIDKVRGMAVTITTTAPTDEEGRRLLALLGMPFRQH